MHKAQAVGATERLQGLQFAPNPTGRTPHCKLLQISFRPCRRPHAEISPSVARNEDGPPELHTLRPERARTSHLFLRFPSIRDLHELGELFVPRVRHGLSRQMGQLYGSPRVARILVAKSSYTASPRLKLAMPESSS